MMQTGFNIIQKVRHRFNLPVITSIEGASDPDELQFIEWLVQTCEEIRRSGPMRQQLMTYEFDTVASTNTYPLPGDFYEAVPMTQYNQDTDWKLIGPLTDSEFMAFKEGVSSIPSEYVWRIKGFDENPSSVNSRQFEVYPTPTAAENLTFEYVTGHLFIPPNWAASTAYTTTQYVNLNGKIYKCSSNGTSGSTGPTGTGAAQSDGTAAWDYFLDPYETLTTDEDMCIFDADVVKLGIRAKYYYDRTDPVAPKAEQEYLDAITKMKFRWEGQTRARGDNRSRSHNQPFVKPGSWSFA